MENMNIVDNNLALTVRKEHRLIVVNNVVHTSARLSKKIVFAVFALNILNLIV